jgi:hypothetical protein
MNFLRRISKAGDYDIQTRTLGEYLMEISLVNSLRSLYPTRNNSHTPMMAGTGTLKQRHPRRRQTPTDFLIRLCLVIFIPVPSRQL